MKRWAVLVIVMALWPMVASAQGAQLYGNRLQGAGGWLLPVPTLHLGSDEADHTRRGSINSWDLVAPAGTVVYAAAPGVVKTLGCNLYESGKWATMQGYGCALHIQHSDSVATQYGHCAQGSFMVQAGQRVTEWTPICTVGWTGQTSFGPHIHFVILRGGGAARIDNVFSKAAMYHQRLSNAQSSTAVTGGVGVVNTAGAVQPGQQPTATGQPSATVAQNRLTQLLQLLRTVKPEVISMTVVGFLGLLALIWWLGGLLERIFVVSLLTSTIVVAVGLWLVMPVAGQAQAGGLSAGLPVPADGVWKLAYQFVTRWEGERCTADGAHTYAGVTQGAWNRFTSRHGLPKSDVCAAKPNKDVRGMVFYEDYWLGSGADKLPGSIAIIHSDFAYNVGTGANGPAMRILRQCGNDAQCYIERRLSWYLNECGNCAQGHINRTMDVVNYIKRLQQKGQ